MADLNPNVQHSQDIVDAISSAEQFLMFDENQDDPLLDDLVNGMADESSGNVVGNYGICFEENLCNENSEYTDFPQASAFGNPVRIPVWPTPPSPHSCTCCQTLREFFHINGNHVLKLHIHGMLGLITHAVMEKFNANMPSENHEYHMFDFCQESISNVKQFLVRYCNDRKSEGYIMLQDPLSIFYGALCIGLDGNGTDMSLQQPSGGDGQMNQEDCGNQPEEEGNGVRPHKNHIASQRERTGKMKLKDLAAYFHLPINAASKELNICSSAIKGICRKEGLLRWPYRKIKSINSEISKKQQSLNSCDANERARVMTEIEELQQRLDEFYQAHGGG